MSWIDIIPYDKATGQLKKLYERVVGPDNNIDNILMVHSLRPHTLQGHMSLYKNVLHHSRNTIDKSFLETLGVYVSQLNQCHYCTEHHFHGLKRLLKNDSKASSIWNAFKNQKLEGVFNPKEILALKYARRLTLDVVNVTKDLINELKNAGWSDGEILEINQVVSYFNYANRTVNGLGVNTTGDILGLSPNDSYNEENWSHS